MIIACPRCEATYAVDVAVFGARTRIVQCSACHYRWPQPGEADSEPDGQELASSCSPRSGGDDSPAVVESLPDDAGQTVAMVEPSRPNSADGDVGGAEAVVTKSGEDKPATLPDAVHPPALSPDKAAAECDPPPTGAPPAEPAGPQLRPGGGILVAATAAAATALSLTALLILLRGPVVSTMPDAAKLYGLIGLAPDPLGQGLQIREIASARERVAGQDLLKVTGMVANVVQSREPLPTLRITLFDTADQELQWVTVPPALESLDPGQTLPFEAEIPIPSPDARLLRVGFVAPPN
jgi:predicted Zn finger-like uncharacterized protein